MELELTEEEAAILGEALECFIVHPTTDDDSRDCAIDLAHHLLALAAGQFDDWDTGEAEQSFFEQGIVARSKIKEKEAFTSKAAERRHLQLVTNDPIDW